MYSVAREKAVTLLRAIAESRFVLYQLTCLTVRPRQMLLTHLIHGLIYFSFLLAALALRIALEYGPHKPLLQVENFSCECTVLCRFLFVFVVSS